MLRGLGVTMALPWLESLQCLGRRARRQGRRARPRCGWPCSSPATGSTAGSGGPRAKARTWSSGQVLAPLADFREKMLFIRGLYNERGPEGEHPQLADRQSALRRAAGLRRRDPLGHEHRPGAGPATYGRSTKVPSLVLGCEKSNPSVHKNYSMLYSSHISWSSPTTPTPLELYPALAFDRLFKDEVQRGDKSVLDAVLADAKRPAPADQHRPTSASSTNTSTRSATSSSASQARASRASCRAGGRRSTSPTSPVRPTASRRTSPTTCG